MLWHLCALLWNENQLGALFVLRSFRQSTSTCFGHICSQSSGGTLYIYNNWYLSWNFIPIRRKDNQLTAQHIPVFVYIYSIPPDDGLQICPKHVEFDCRNKLRLSSASSWFSLQTIIEMHGQKNVKFGTSTIDCSGLVTFYSEERSRRTLRNVCKHVLHHTM